MTGYQTGTGNRMTNDGTFTHTYDAEGNLTKKSKGTSAETWTYGYDHRNQMTWAEQRATDGGTLQLRVEYEYDAFARRVSEEKWTSGTGTVTTRFGYLDEDVWVDLDGSNALKDRYVRPDGIDGLAATVSSGGTVGWYLTDRLGSVHVNLDSSGTPINTVTYDVFGKVTNETSAGSGDRYKYTGRELDGDTGLAYHRRRYYDPATGRWTTRDPIEFLAGDTNLYRYIGNYVTGGTDPEGLDFIRRDETNRNIYYVVGEPGPDNPGILIGRQHPTSTIVYIYNNQNQRITVDLNELRRLAEQWEEMGFADISDESILRQKYAIFFAVRGLPSRRPTVVTAARPNRHGAGAFSDPTNQLVDGALNRSTGVLKVGSGGNHWRQDYNTAGKSASGLIKQMPGHVATTTLTIGAVIIPGPDDVIIGWFAQRGYQAIKQGGAYVIKTIKGGRQVSSAQAKALANQFKNRPRDYLGTGQQTMTPPVIPQGVRLTSPPSFSSNFKSKIGSKLNQLKKKYPHVRPLKNGGVDDAKKVAQQAVARGGGRRGPPVGQGDTEAIYFDDGPVTWVFRPNGEFWSMRINKGWTP